jgi:hypothetical protein
MLTANLEQGENMERRKTKKKRTRIQIFMSFELHDRIRAAARADDRPQTTWVRRVVEAELQRRATKTGK